MLVVRIVLAICCIKFVVMAILVRKEDKPIKASFISLAIALFWLLLFAISFVHI